MKKKLESASQSIIQRASGLNVKADDMSDRKSRAASLLLSLFLHLQRHKVVSIEDVRARPGGETHQVQRQAGLEPRDLALVERVRERELLLRAVLGHEHEHEVLVRQFSVRRVRE